MQKAYCLSNPSKVVQNNFVQFSVHLYLAKGQRRMDTIFGGVVNVYCAVSHKASLWRFAYNIEEDGWFAALPWENRHG